MAIISAAIVSGHDPKLLYMNSKSTTVKVGEVEATMSYYSPPATESHLAEVKKGDFKPWYGSLSLSQGIKSGSKSIAAGEYVVGAIKKRCQRLDNGSLPRED